MKKEILSLKNCKRIAIMGGTFDPIHYGHLVAAEAVSHKFAVDKVLFIPTGNPALKLDKIVTASEHRYLMTVLATVTNPLFEVSRIEIDRVGITYTIDTIREILAYCGTETEILFITGADAVYDILGWRESDELLTLCKFVAVTRPGYNSDKLKEKIKEIKGMRELTFNFLEIPALSISSTDIRNRMKTGKPIKYLLPEGVEQYVYKFNLYKDSSLRELIDEKMKGLLTKERYTHSLGVASEAVKLSKKYDVDPDKAFIAGLLHDIAKDLSDDELRNLCTKYKIKLYPAMEENINLTHGFVGSKLAKEVFGIMDKDILNAICYHTTGRAKMSVLEKVIYLADVIEPNRKDFDGLAEGKKLVYKNIDKAMIYFLETTIEYTKNRNLELIELSVDAIDFLKKK